MKGVRRSVWCSETESSVLHFGLAYVVPLEVVRRLCRNDLVVSSHGRRVVPECHALFEKVAVRAKYTPSRNSIHSQGGSRVE